MTETHDMVLAGRTFAVPPLPLRYNRVVYPLCRDLSLTDGEDDTECFLARLLAANGTPEAVRDDEWPKLEKIALHCAMAADKAFTAEAFDDLAIAPQQLIDAFFVARTATGVWIPPKLIGEDQTLDEGSAMNDAEPGEAAGLATPQ